ncbi:MAG: preprotein translocase subunit SecY, partial [Lentisphaeria bacterium]
MLRAYFNSIKVPELRKRIFFTFAILAVCRLAANIPVPGINPEGLAQLFEDIKNSSGSGVMDVVNIFSGGALQNFAIAALGIMPYISASIIIQLITPIIPALEKLQREGDSGRQQMNQITRWVTIVICIVQGLMLAAGMESPADLNLANVQVVTTPGWMFRITTMLILMAGTLALMWLGEQITERGVGNGVSIIITVNIISRLPQAILELFNLTTDQDFTTLHILLMVIFFLICTAGTVALNQGVRQIPIRYAARRAGASANVGQTTYMPLKVNFSGVMPLIFASAVLMFASMFFNYLASWSSSVTNPSGFDTAVSKFGQFFAPYLQHTSGVYLLVYSLCIIIFTFFWVANQFNPIRIADDLKRGGAYIPGVRPGEPTAQYIDHSMT